MVKVDMVVNIADGSVGAICEKPEQETPPSGRASND